MSQERRVVKKKKKFGIVLEFVPVSRNLFADDETMEKIQGELKRARGITPQYLADKYAIRVSTAKRILKDAETKNIIQEIAGNRRIKVYSASK